MFICFGSQQTLSKEFSVKPLEIYLQHKISVTSALGHIVAVTVSLSVKTPQLVLSAVRATGDERRLSAAQMNARQGKNKPCG